MPQGRIILKSISESRKLADLKTDSARLLYTWIIPQLDINGCFSGDPTIINSKVFTRLTHSIQDVEEYLNDLSKNELIVFYKARGDIFLIVPDFKEKQPNLSPKKEAIPTIPTPTLELLQTNSGLTLTQVKQSFKSEGGVPGGIVFIKPENLQDNLSPENQTTIAIQENNLGSTPELLQTNSTTSKVKQSKDKELLLYISLNYTPKEFKEDYNTICSNLNKCIKIDNKRFKPTELRIIESGKLIKEMNSTITVREFWCKIFMIINKVEIVDKKDNHKWIPSLDWIVENDNNFVKVAEGKYIPYYRKEFGLVGVNQPGIEAFLRKAQEEESGKKETGTQNN